MVLLFDYFPLPILHQYLYRNSLKLHQGYLPSSILSRSVYLLHTSFLKLCLLLLFSFTNRCYKATSTQYGILNLQVNRSIINPHHSTLEPQLILSNTCFDGRFGIPFQNKSHITNIRIPQSSENLTLYKLHTLIPLYPSVLSTPIIRQLVLHILPSYLIQTLSSTIPSTYRTNPIAPSHHKYISHYFYLQLIPSSLMWKDTYTTDKESTILMQYLIYHQDFDTSLYHHFRHNIVMQLLILHSVLLKIVLYFMNQFRQLLIKNVAL